MSVEVVTPEEFMGDVVADLNRRRGMISGMDGSPSGKLVRADVALSEMFGYSTDLRSRSQGRATYTMEFVNYAEVPQNVMDKLGIRRGPPAWPSASASRGSAQHAVAATDALATALLAITKGWRSVTAA